MEVETLEHSMMWVFVDWPSEFVIETGWTLLVVLPMKTELETEYLRSLPYHGNQY